MDLKRTYNGYGMAKTISGKDRTLNSVKEDRSNKNKEELMGKQNLSKQTKKPRNHIQ